MNKFLFKSTDADLQKIYQSLESIQKNVLYVTHRVDRIIQNQDIAIHNKALQKQVDDYFEENDETSPQTEQETPPEEVESLG